MNFHQPHALTSRIDTSQALRRLTSVARTTVLVAFLLADFTAILAMSWLTGISYHLLVYQYAGETVNYLKVGLISAVIFVTPNLFRGEYSLPNFFPFKPHLRRRDQPRQRTSICLLALGFMAQITVIYSRGWILTFYALTIAVLLALRYGYVRMTVVGSRTGLISAQRIYLVGAGRGVEDFVTRYQPRTFGINIVGCHFLTPVAADAPPELRDRTLARDLDQAVTGARVLQPEAIVLVMPARYRSDFRKPIHCAAAAELHLAEHIPDASRRSSS